MKTIFSQTINLWTNFLIVYTNLLSFHVKAVCLLKFSRNPNSLQNNSCPLVSLFTVKIFLSSFTVNDARVYSRYSTHICIFVYSLIVCFFAVIIYLPYTDLSHAIQFKQFNKVF